VAGVRDGVGAGVAACTRLPALRGPSPTRNRGVQQCATARAGQLFETYAGTGLAVAAVTKVFTSVEGAGKHLSAYESAIVIYLNTAELRALVSAARPLLLTALLAARVVGATGQLGAGDLLVHVPAPAPHKGSLNTRWARTCMTDGRAGVRVGRRSAGQLRAAGHPTGWYGIQTALPRRHSVPLVEFLQGRLAAGAGGDPAWGEQAGCTATRVAGHVALMLLAVTRLLTEVLADVLGDPGSLRCTNCITYTLAAVTNLADDFKTIVAGPLVADVLALVHPAVQLLVADALASKHLSTLYPHLFSAARTCCQDGCSAGRTGSRVAELDTGVGARISSFPTTHLAAGMRNQALVPLPFGVPQLPAEAAVLGRSLGAHGLTTRASPSPLLGAGGLSPLLDAIQMENLKAIMTVPSSIVLSDSVKTNHTLGLTADQLIGQPNPKVGSSEQGQLALHSSLLAIQVFWRLI